MVYEADTLIHQGKIKEASVLMDKAVQEMDSQHPLYTTYALKRALLRLDSGDASLEKQGREELEALAQDKNNSARDSALYYSGLYAENRADKAQAEKRFKEIVDQAHEQSYWYQLAQNKLKVGV